MDKKKEMLLLVGAIVVIFLVYFLFFYNSGKINSKSNAQSSINIFYNSCSSCSNSALNIIYSLFNSDKSTLKAENVSFNSSEGNSIVSNYSITALPTILINETNSSENVLDSLVYLNVFNIEGNKFVLNTPFLAGLTKGITYFDLIQGRKVTAFDIFNQSEIYNNTNKNVINPSQILYLFNSSGYTSGNKTLISFIYSNSSFSAVQSMILYKALNAFGKFSNLNVITSPSVSFSTGETLGNTEFYQINGSRYQSPYFAIESSSLQNLSSSKYVNTLEKELFDFDQNSAYPFFSNLGNFMPFIDIGGRYVEVSSMINPRIFEDDNITQIKQLIKTNQTVGRAFNDSVYFIQTLLCSYINYNETPCNSTQIKNDLKQINSLT
ncbi:hypothetical protein M1558_02545 [Candidatus Parvarchaeota archaeon]|nr:hypothetical protein [Candidatus Parvarchaeota archaeon]